VHSVIDITDIQQRLYEIMMDEVIPSFPKAERDHLVTTARKWRLPYWDWAAKKPRNAWQPAGYRIPLIAENRTISVLTPNGTATIPNPMYVFTTPQPMGVHGIEPVNGIPVSTSFRIEQKHLALVVRYMPGNQQVPARKLPDGMDLRRPK
jgi:hypothetical protein